MKIFKVTEPVFKTEPVFVLNATAEQLRRWLRERFRIDQDIAADIDGSMFTFQHSPYRVVWVKNGQDLPVLVHEITHLVTRICHDRGIRIVAKDESGFCGDESAAYLIEYFFREALKRTRKH